MRKMEGPDRGWSWVVAFACCFASLVLAGIFRTSGVLFVAFINTYGVTREEASWPMVTCISVLNLTGPFSGILGQKFGARPIIIIGALLATAGISACYFTTSLKVITILFGGVFGVGYGFMNTLMPVILNAYFLNLRATANGIANSGSCIGSLILPIVFESLIATYGLSGCFLLTGGIVLHIAVAACLMRPPPWIARSKKKTKCKAILNEGGIHVNSSAISQNLSDNHQCNNAEKQLEECASPKTFEGKEPISQFKCKTTSCPPNDLQHSPTMEVPQALLKRRACTQNDSGNTSDNEIPKCEPTDSGTPQLDYGKTFHNGRNDREIPEQSSPFVILRSRLKQSRTVQSFISVLTCPMFYVTAITNVCFYFLYHMYVVIIIDYALDKGVPEENTKYILFAFSISDLIGRLCLGWITDRNFVSRSHFTMGCMTVIGIVFFMFPYAVNYKLLMAVSCCYGLLLGCTMVVFPILLVDFCGLELHAVAYGCMCFMNGFASFGRPFLIGYFRDSVGSYSSIFYILGIISVVASTLWLLERNFLKKREFQQQQSM